MITLKNLLKINKLVRFRKSAETPESFKDIVHLRSSQISHCASFNFVLLGAENPLKFGS